MPQRLHDDCFWARDLLLVSHGQKINKTTNNKCKPSYNRNEWEKLRETQMQRVPVSGPKQLREKKTRACIKACLRICEAQSSEHASRLFIKKQPGACIHAFGLMCPKLFAWAPLASDTKTLGTLLQEAHWTQPV